MSSANKNFTTKEHNNSHSLTTTPKEDGLFLTKSNESNLGDTVKPNPKVLSTAVVTSVSVQESLQDSLLHPVTEPPKYTSTNKSYPTNTTTRSDTLHSLVLNRNSSHPKAPVRSFITNKNNTNSTSTLSHTALNSTSDTKGTTVKIETPLRSREIYRPKAIPPGSFIPHLPRQIPISSSHGSSPKIAIHPELITATVSQTTNKPILINLTSTTTSTSIRSTSSPATTVSQPTSKPFLTNSSSTTTSTTIRSTPRPSTTIDSTTTSPATVHTTPITQKPVTYPPKLSTTTKRGLQEVPEIEVNKVTESVPPINLSQNAPVSPTLVSRVAPKESVIPKPTQPFTTEVDEQSSTGMFQPSTKNDEVSSPSDESSDSEPSQAVETESVPPPKREETQEGLNFVPEYSPNDESDDQFPIYFTTVPVVDTRPDMEAAVVQEQKNTTTVRPGGEWVKVGAVDKEVEVVYPEPLGAGAYVLAALGVVPILVGALIGARFIMAHNKKKVLDESEYSSEYNRSPLGITTVTPLPTKLPRIPTHVSWGETEKSAPTITPVTSASTVRWEFPREKLRLQTVLGQGNFGQVWKAEADDISGHEGLTRLVAVKTVKETANLREREDLLRELGIMQELGSHPNVVTLLGCCTEKEPIYLLMEYVMYGKLLSFLRDHRTRAHYYNFSDATDALTSRDLTVFAYCVARGMDYLTNKSIIHRDLAARNVLVDHNKLCKIADFGMSRNVRDTGQIYEQRQSKGALPIRWMAPESLHFSLFTHKTDVWSFGILMWEIVTLGSTPYATMGAREVMRRVRDGYRLDRPSHCRPELFRVISRCWQSEPSKRPSFAELKVELGQLLSDAQLNGSYVDLDSFADEMRRDTLHRHH